MNLHKFLIVFLLLVFQSTISESQMIKGVGRPDHPRMKDGYDKPGDYEIIIVPTKTVLDKGDSFRIDVYFTGYGEIGLSKIYITFGGDILDTQSYILTSVDYKDHLLRWGAMKAPIIPHPKSNVSLRLSTPFISLFL